MSARQTASLRDARMADNRADRKPRSGGFPASDGKAEKIDFATPKTNTNDPVVVPDTGNALKTLREILDPKGGR